MKNRYIFAVTFLLASLIVVNMTVKQKDPKTRIYEPIGYVKKLNLLIESGLISYDSGNGKILFNSQSATREIIDFYNNSRLRSDIELFNTGYKRGSFFLKDGKLNVDRRAHSIILPFSKYLVWEGDISYNSSDTFSVIENRDTTIRFVHPPGTLLPLDAVHYKEVHISNLSGIYTGYAFHFWHRGMRIIQLEFIGDDVVLMVKYKEPKVYINGFSIPEGNNVRLDDGDMILLSGTGVYESFIYKKHGTLGILSSSKNVNGNIARIETPGPLPLSETLSIELQNLIRTIDLDQEKIKFNIVLTVDQELQSIIQEKLEDFMRDGTSGGYAPAAITVMDAKSGDILALASYPTRDKLSAYSSKRLNDAKRRRLELNQNLLLHPTGSVIKPFLAVSIWHMAPPLGELRIKKHSSENIDNVLGIRLSSPYGAIPHDTLYSKTKRKFPIGRREFLQYSCNKYMAELFFLSLSKLDERGRPVYTETSIPVNASLGDRDISRMPDFSRYLTGDKVVNIETHPIASILAENFDIDTISYGYTDARENTSAAYDTGILKPILDHLALDELSARALYSICPERVNQRLNRVRLLREDLVSIFLGGSYSEWSNIKLAEAISRLATGRKVSARLISDITDESRNSTIEKPVSFDSLDKVALDDDPIAWVREGMSLPTELGGTAASLVEKINSYKADLKKQGLSLKIYTKTGSPRKRDIGPDSALFIFYLGINRKDEILCGLSGAVYIEDRGSSSLAVKLARSIMDNIFEYLKDQINRMEISD